MNDLRHPIRGHRLAPIGWRKNGSPIWPIMGGSEGAGTESSGGSGDSGGASGSQSGTEGSGDTGSQSGATGGDAGKEGEGSQSGSSADKVERSEYESVKARQAAADRRAAAAEAELQKIKDKDKSELEIAQRDKKTAEETVVNLQSEVNNLRMKVAFLSDAQVQWHDPADALLFLTSNPEQYGLTVEEDGSVKGMKEAIKRLADSKKHLVKGEGNGTGGGSASGSNVGGAGSGNRDRKAVDEDSLRKKFPALRR